MADGFALHASVFIMCLLLPLRFANGTSSTADCPSLCECFKAKGEMICSPEFQPDGEFHDKQVPQWLKSIHFVDGPLHCDCGLKQFLRRSGVRVFGICSGDRGVHELTPEDVPCDVQIRKRRAVVPVENVNVAKATIEPGGDILPCDFEEGFCQWYHSSDSEFHWQRNTGSTPTTDTGPVSDHTTGTGWYIYTETSDPRRPGQAARLASPTLAPVNQSEPCVMDLFIHMHGSDIGSLTIYQVPVGGFRNAKKTWVGQQGRAWLHKNVQFDSDQMFQIVIESVRGRHYKSDVALDDITFSPGCRRLAPSYVRVSGGDFKSGRVEVYQKPDWKPVCQDGWTDKDATVACKELGFENSNSINDVSSSQSLEGLPTLGCDGNETSVRQCANGRHCDVTWCAGNKTAAVNCSRIAPVCPSFTHVRCSPMNGTAKCISQAQLCDFREDCWDGSDEQDCSNYTRCDFEDSGLCGWIGTKIDGMKWQRHEGSTPSPFTGPREDHKGNPDGHYLYTEVSERTGGEKARIFVTPRFQGDHGGECRVSFFYHMYGWNVGHLRLYARDAYSQKEVWSKSYQQGNRWMKAEVTLANMSRSFQVVFESEHSGQGSHGDIAIDDVSFTPECRPAQHENITCSEETFQCGTDECVSLEDVCDFQADCYDGSDELNCGVHTPGRCNFELDLCDWTNATDEDFDWQRHSGHTPSLSTGPQYDHTQGFNAGGYYLYIEASSPRKYGDKARIMSPQFVWANVKNCKLRFFYHMFGSNVGRLIVYLKNTITLQNTTIWQKYGFQGNKWWRAEVPIETNWTVAQVVIEGIRGTSFSSDIAIDDISFSPSCYSSEDIHLVKNYAVRLVGAGSSFEGRVEIFNVGQWGTICSNEWDQNDADVVCRQLGYSRAKSFPGEAHYGPGRGRIWLDDLRCRGNETDLSQCAHAGWGQNECDHSQDASVVCSKDGSTKPVRLVEGNTTREGRVEIYHHNSWGSICFDGWDLHDAFVVCRSIGYSGAKEIKRHSTKTSSLWLKDARCRGNEASLGQCPNSGWGGASCSYGYAGLVCSGDDRSDGDVRLAGGSSPKEGRVEIFYRGEWGTVCDDNWSATNARVVCYQLGFTSVVSYQQSFGPGVGRVWMNDVMCTGNESGLALCPHRGWGVGYCLHDEDVGIICSDDAYVGCYKDRVNHVMPHRLAMRDLTPVKCLRYCDARGSQYAGLTFATDCYCGDRYDTYGKDDESKCDTPCPGDNTKKCGGPFSLSVYSTVVVPPTPPGFTPVIQSCSRLYYYFPLQIRVPISSPNYFHGNSTGGAIWSPGHPGQYPVLLECVWVLNLQPGSQVKIEFEKFRTEKDFDYIEVRDGKRDYSRRLTPDGGFTGNFSQTLVASSSVMWIKFYSDQSVSFSGFKLIYTAIGLPTTVPIPTTTVSLSDLQKVEGGCQPDMDEVTTQYEDENHNSGYIFTPSYPNEYRNNLLCQWIIYVIKGYKINVEVQDLDVQHSSGGVGPGDVLRIDDGVTHHVSTDRGLPWVFNSSGHFVRVSFASDRANTGKGFRLKYERAIFTSAKPQSTTTKTNEPDSGNKDYRARKEEHKHEGLSGGGIAGIVLAILALVVLAGVFAFCLKKKKRHNNQGVRHGFVNAAYDTATFGLEPTPQAQASESQTQPSPYEELHAPPPYSQISQPALYATSPLQLMTPVAPVKGPDAGAYANLYSAPPAYEAPAHGAGTTTTGLGSVTSLRDIDGNEVLPPRPQAAPMAVEGFPMVRSRPVLPPIRGAHETEDAKKVALPDDQAGPLPEKTPLSVDTPLKSSAPARPPSAQSTIRLVSPADAAMDDDVPFEFLCPLTNQIMKDPVTAADGYTYEKRAIRSWLRRHSTNPISPMTNETLPDMNLQRNDELRQKIEDFKSRHSTV